MFYAGAFEDLVLLGGIGESKYRQNATPDVPNIVVKAPKNL